ncbi:MAG: GNAT family N-acetyltransferase, partial [Candidatus Cloacimonetes bacterium]|nr:GNAT family N-acetyltransferase [Candidatus Cloacimonadota bacterium]
MILVFIPIKIRSFAPKDKKVVSGLYYALHPVEEKERKEKGLLVPVEKSRLETILLVAEEDNQIVGFVWGNLIVYGFFRYGTIEELFVKRELRNRGIGGSLIEAIIKRFERLKVKVVFVTTEKENEEAINLYKKLGFKLCKGPWFYWNP